MSTCVKRVGVVANELGVSYELVPVDWAARQHKSEEWLATRNPFGQIPSAEFEDFNLYESRAIGRYLIERFDKDNKLHPADLKEKAFYELFLSVEVEEFNGPASGIVSECIFKKMFGGGEPDLDRVEELAKKLVVSLDVLEKRLSSTGFKFLVSDKVSYADLVYLSYADLLLNTPKAELISSRPHVAAWLERLRNLPSWQKLNA